MMAAILNSAMLDWDTAILDSDTLLSFLRFTQKHYPSTLTLTQTNSNQLTRWWQPSWILPCWIQTLSSSMQTPCCLLSDSLQTSLTPFWLWLKLILSDLKLFILTQLNEGSHLEFCHLWFIDFVQKNFTQSFWLNLMMAAILNSANLNLAILDSTILDFPLKLTHTCQD